MEPIWAFLGFWVVIGVAAAAAAVPHLFVHDLNEARNWITVLLLILFFSAAAYISQMFS